MGELNIIPDGAVLIEGETIAAVAPAGSCWSATRAKSATMPAGAPSFPVSSIRTRT
jgi:hypothetical protein